MIPERYVGREQAFIKHSLLKAYLERLFMIIGQFETDISYVDCFAGPWQEGSDDLKGTSIAVSLDIMRRCQEGLDKIGKRVEFRGLFIEKEKKPFTKLQSFLKTEPGYGIETFAMHGEFYNLRNDILKWCGEKDFTFFFIDPKGWKNAIEIPTLRPLLQRHNSEYLINFMYDFILRSHSQEIFSRDMEDIFGEVPKTDDMTPEQKENYLLSLYRTHVKAVQTQSGRKPRSAYVKVLDLVKERTKYHLIYLTRHPKGIKVFMEISQDLEIIQKKVRAYTKQEKRIQKSKQQELFSSEVGIQDDKKVELTEVKKYWLNQLSLTPKRFGVEELADMLEETDWFIRDFQKAFNELVAEGKVQNLGARKKRPVHAVHFDTGEYLVKLIP